LYWDLKFSILADGLVGQVGQVEIWLNLSCLLMFLLEGRWLVGTWKVTYENDSVCAGDRIINSVRVSLRAGLPDN
jgi:hypothetical protein